MTGQVIPANYDPSVSGLAGDVGDIVGVAGGASAWVKIGTAPTDWSSFPTSGGGVAAITAETGALVGVDSSDPENPIITGALSYFKTAEIDLTVLNAVFDLVPARAGKRWRTLLLKEFVISNGAGLSVASVVKFGTNATSYDNFNAGVTLGGAHPAGVNYNLPFEAALNYADADVGTTPLRGKVTTAAAGDVQSASFEILGSYY